MVDAIPENLSTKAPNADTSPERVDDVDTSCDHDWEEPSRPTRDGTYFYLEGGTLLDSASYRFAGRFRIGQEVIIDSTPYTVVGDNVDDKGNEGVTVRQSGKSWKKPDTSLERKHVVSFTDNGDGTYHVLWDNMTEDNLVSVSVTPHPWARGMLDLGNAVHDAIEEGMCLPPMPSDDLTAVRTTIGLVVENIDALIDCMKAENARLLALLDTHPLAEGFDEPTPSQCDTCVNGAVCLHAQSAMDERCDDYRLEKPIEGMADLTPAYQCIEVLNCENCIKRGRNVCPPTVSSPCTGWERAPYPASVTTAASTYPKEGMADLRGTSEPVQVTYSTEGYVTHAELHDYVEKAITRALYPRKSSQDDGDAE
jgi:hypothetical protein